MLGRDIEGQGIQPVPGMDDIPIRFIKRERICLLYTSDIDDIVKIVRFDGWQNTTAGRQEVKKALRSVVWVKYKIKDKEVFDKAYSYIEQYY